MPLTRCELAAIRKAFKLLSLSCCCYGWLSRVALAQGWMLMMRTWHARALQQQLDNRRCHGCSLHCLHDYAMWEPWAC